MAVTIKNIIPRKHAENSQVTQYTATNATVIIDKFTATNTSSNHAYISVHLVALGDTAGSDNLVLNARYIAPKEAYLCPELVGQVLENGGFISTLAGSANAIVISASAREIT